MTNAPENFESYVLPDGVEKLEYTPDPKLPNAGTFKLEREDHTLGNLLRMQLLRDKRVVFVGYKNPHPLEHHVLLRVHTVVAVKPRQVLESAVECLQGELRDISSDLAGSGAPGAKGSVVDSKVGDSTVG